MSAQRSGSPNIQRIKFYISILIFQLDEIFWREIMYGVKIKDDIPLKLYFLVLETKADYIQIMYSFYDNISTPV